VKVSVIRNSPVDPKKDSPILSIGEFWRFAGTGISPWSHGLLDFSHLLSQSLMNDYEEA
jgi:hypothetical protein